MRVVPPPHPTADYQQILLSYELAKRAYARTIPGSEEYREAKRAVAAAGARVYILALELGIKPIGGFCQ